MLLGGVSEISFLSSANGTECIEDKYLLQQ
jgi:hypothetical protein